MAPKHRRLWLIAAAAVVVALAGTTVVWSMVFADAGQVTSGVTAHGIHLGGLDRDACREKLTAFEQEFTATVLELRYDGHSWAVGLGRLGVGLDIDGITDEALAVGRQGLFVHQWLDRHRIGQQGVDVPLRFSLSAETMEETVSALMGDFTNPPINAGFTVTDRDTVELVPDQAGTGVDFTALGEAILQSVEQSELPPVDIAVIEVRPEHTTADVQAMRLNGLIAQFTTRFNPSLVDRSYNIAVAAKAFDNLLVAPGEVMSFNEIVGPRSREAGYRSAPIIVDNDFEDGMGGGVCQVSSTLYNAVLLADLEIIERKNHSLPIAYVPIGRDATVVYDAVDLKFRNNTDGYVYLKSVVGNGGLTMKVFGDADNFPNVEIHSWVTETIAARVVYEDDEMLEIGEEVVKRKGADGYRVKTERWVRKDGTVDKKTLPGSFYNPQNEVIAVGTREAPPPVVAPVPDPEPWIPDPPETPDPGDSDDADTADGSDGRNNGNGDRNGSGNHNGPNGDHNGPNGDHNGPDNGLNGFNGDEKAEPVNDVQAPINEHTQRDSGGGDKSAP